VPTAILLFLLVPRALALPSTKQLREAKEALELEIDQRRAAERALQEAHAQLEARVVQRTAELGQAYAALETKQHELAEVDRRKDEFLAVLSHELRNPVHAIGTAVAFLSRKHSGDKSIADAMTIIDRQIGTLAKLLGDLLDVVRVTRKNAELHLETIDLRTVVDAVARAVPETTRSERRISVDLPSLPVYVQVDAVRIEQAVTNVVGNAVKYTGANGEIAIHLAVAGSEALISVADDGQGISPSELPHIFDQFVRGQASQQHAAGGLGLGLHIAREMMHAHGGRIEASSGGQGQGSTFVIALPLSDQLPQSETRPPNPLGEMAATLRILVVDDNRDAAISMAALLKTYGHDAEVAYDGAMAVDRAKAIQPDVILLDIGLPDLDGYAVARALRALPWVKRPLLIAVTGWGTPSDRERAFDAGFDEHLTKPIDYASLGEIIKAGLRS
jgi:two-component system CheB/CheR fusion protein